MSGARRVAYGRCFHRLLVLNGDVIFVGADWCLAIGRSGLDGKILDGERWTRSRLRVGLSISSR